MAVASLWLVFFFACLLLLIFLKRSWCFFRPRSSGWSTLQLEYALALRSAVVYVAIGAVPLLFPCSERSASASLKGWDRCPASSYSLVPTNIMRIYHFLPFWYAFLVTPHLGCLISGIHDALLGASTGLCMASLLNLVMPGGAGGTNYLPEDFWQKAWLPFGYHSFAAILFAVCSTYLLFFSSTSVGQKQYALGVFSELLVPFMNPQTTSGFRAVIWDWEFNWNWNGIAMCGFWLVVLAILLAIPSLGLLPWSRESVKRHSCMWSAATELAQLAEDTAGCLEYLLTILQQEAWKFPFHADSSNFYIRQLGMRRTTAEALLEQVAWESWVSGHTREQHKNLQKVAAFLRQLRQLLRIQSGLMRYLGQSTSRGEQFLLEDFVLACSEGLAAVARDCRDKADISTETRLELQRLATKADEVLCKALEKQAKPENAFSSEMAFLDQLRSWAAAFSAFDARQNDAAPSASGGKDANSRHWFALRNTVSWTLALLWSVYSRGYSMGCVVATSFIFSETSGSSFDTNINRILGVGMGLAVGNVPAILILSGTSAENTSSMLRFFAYFVVMFIMWTLAMFGYLAPGSKYYRACLLWVGYGGVQMLRHLPQFDQPDAELFLAILDNIVAIMVVFIVDMVFAYVQGNSTEEQVKAAVTRCAQHVANAVETLQALPTWPSMVIKVDCDMAVESIATKPIEGQKPGTSGLRKKTKVFMEGTYLANYVQSVFNTLLESGVPVSGGTLVVSGDGRFWNPEAIQIIIKMAFAAGVGRIWCGTGGLLSTPATSAVIRCRGKGMEPFGGFICSASHNPGGINDDFGIKYNCENGGPAPEKLTDKMVEWTAKLSELKTCSRIPDFDLSKPQTYELPGGKTVEIFDCVEDHMAVLKQCFDFESIKKLMVHPEFSMTYDSMSGVQGPYALGPESAWHGHADPNLTYAVELVADMGLNKEGQKVETGKAIPKFGAAADGDADRNMILSSQFFVSPSDSLAMIVANSHLIPQFKDGLRGCARSMPTSTALDLVAEKKRIPCFEVPTGWKFFGNLMDSGTSYFPGKETYTPFICGEESFGTGADHVREKDGMWAVLAWLQILAKTTEEAGKLITVEHVAMAHWQEYGRNYYARYDYEGVDKQKAEEMFAAMEAKTGELAGQELGGMKSLGRRKLGIATVAIKINDMFEYTDPVDGSVSKRQGLRFIFEDNSRIVFRLSGTGVAGATVRLYLEKYEPPSGNLSLHQFEVVKPLAAIALELSQLQAFTGRESPTVLHCRRQGWKVLSSAAGKVSELDMDPLQRDIKALMCTVRILINNGEDRSKCGESMLSYVSRRRRWWKLLKSLDSSIELSEPMRVELLLELSGLSRQESLVIKACTSNSKSFEAIAATLVEHCSGVHLKEGRSLGGGTFKDRRHNNHGARNKSNPKGYGKGKTKGFTRRAYIAEDEAQVVYDDAYPQEDEDAEDYDDTSYPAFGDEAAEYEARKGKGKGRGKSKGKVVRSHLTLEERRDKMKTLKAKSKCLRCGAIGHWAGDPECKFPTSKGGKAQPKGRAHLAIVTPKQDPDGGLYVPSGNDEDAHAYMVNELDAASSKAAPARPSSAMQMEGGDRRFTHGQRKGQTYEEVLQEFHRERKAVSEKLLEATEMALPIVQPITADDATADLDPEAVLQLLGGFQERVQQAIALEGADSSYRPPRLAQGGHHLGDGPQSFRGNSPLLPW
eukprot:s2973_g7.t1